MDLIWTRLCRWGRHRANCMEKSTETIVFELWTCISHLSDQTGAKSSPQSTETAPLCHTTEWARINTPRTPWVIHSQQRYVDTPPSCGIWESFLSTGVGNTWRRALNISELSDLEPGHAVWVPTPIPSPARWVRVQASHARCTLGPGTTSGSIVETPRCCRGLPNPPLISPSNQP